MPTTITPTAPTFSSIESPVVLATATIGTVRTLDLTTKWGAWVLVRMGRRVATALTRSAYVAIRKSSNSTLVIPNVTRDCISQTGTAQSNTVSSGGTSGSNSVTLTSATGFAIGDTICLHSDDTNANRVEFARITNISSNTLTVEANFKTTHNANDRVTSLADCFEVWIAGGDIYEITCVNSSGYSIVYAVDAITYASDTAT